MCDHENFVAIAEVHRMVNAEDQDSPHAFMCELRVQCAHCDAPFGFKGMPGGVSPDQPMVSVDTLEARLPLASPTELALAGLSLPPVERPPF